MSVVICDEADLRALVERTCFTTEAAEIEGVVEEVLAARKAARAEARRDIMLMAAILAPQIAELGDMTSDDGRAHIAAHAVAMALAIEKATPR